MTTTVVPHRLMEAVVMLPILHAPAGKLEVGVVGPMSEQMAAEALRWRDVAALYMLEPPKQLKDRRIQLTKKMPAAKLQVMLLSPEQSPMQWTYTLAQGGIINPTTISDTQIQKLKTELQERVGATLPWREYLPQPVYGVLSKHSTDRKIERTRQPPINAKRLSKQYLPCLFTFGKDEIPAAFAHRPARATS